MSKQLIGALIVLAGLLSLHTVQAKKFPYMEYSRATSKTITTTVRGLGNTGAAAYADAIRQAREISGGSYGNLGSTRRKVGNSWICDLKISYSTN